MVAGLLLPAEEDLGPLAGDGPLWGHLLPAWDEQLRFERWAAAAPGHTMLSNPMPLLLWARCVDDRPPPAALQPQLQRLADQIGARLLSDPSQLGPGELGHGELQQGQRQQGLDALLRSSTLLMLLPPAPAGFPTPSLPSAAIGFQRLWEQRLRRSQAHHTTLLAEHQPDAGGLRWRHHPPRGSERNDMAPRTRSRRQQQRFLRRHLGHWSASWMPRAGQAPEAAHASIRGDQLSDQAWQSERAVAWAQGRARSSLGRVGPPLRAGCLTLLPLAWLLTALAGRGGLAFSLALYGGAGLLAWAVLREPREEARQWWALAIAFWVQDTWHRFNLNDAPLSRFTDPKPHPAHRLRPGPLLPLLEAHQLALRFGPPPPPWNAPQLTDVVATLQQRLEQLEQLQRIARRRRWIRWGGVLVMAALLLLLMLDPGAPITALWLKQALLSLWFVAWIQALLHPPAPLAEERLRRHEGQLLQELRQLEEWQRGSELNNRDLRAAIEASVRRLGEEELDLARDGLEASPW